MYATRLERNERTLVFLIFLALAVPAWVRGGTPIPLRWLLLPPGILVLAGLLVIPIADGARGSALSTLCSAVGRLLRDPIFYLGVAFLALLCVQWWNSGRYLVLDYEVWKWVYSAPRVANLPSAVQAREASQMVCWFFPAWALMLAMRAGILSRDGTRSLFKWMVLNSAAISIFGIVQFLSGTRSIYWLTPIEAHFFGSFGYSGHVGAFFLLMFGLCCGLIVDGSFDRKKRIAHRELAILLGAAVLTFVGANLSLAIAPTILVWTFGSATAFYVLAWTWWRLDRVRKVYVMLGILGIACLGYIIIALLFRSAPERVQASLWELGEAGVVQHKFDERLSLAKAAISVWKEAPWFGTGGWGFRYFLGMVLDPAEWKIIGIGDANVHNDFLQFLSEFGAVGTALLLGTLGALISPILRSRAWRRPVVLIPSTAALLVLAYSFMDLPFRSPAILYAWCTLLAAMPAFVVSNRDDVHEL